MRLNGPKVIIALDFPSMEQAIQLATQLDPEQCRFKVGKELFVSSGTQVVNHLINEGFDVFLDLKFHDIPNTAARAYRAAYELGVWMVSVHCLGGRRMLEVITQEAATLSGPKPLLVGVTVLTSFTGADLPDIGIAKPVAEEAHLLAQLAKDSGLDGIVCSPHEVTGIKQQYGPDFLCVTPGIRPQSKPTDDQQRIMTPAQAMAAGSDYLVIGRPITQADNPLGTLQKINVDINK